MARRRRGFFAELQHQVLEQQRHQARMQRERERSLAQAIREEDRARRANERAQAQVQRELRAQYVAQRQTEAATLTRSAQDRAAALESILIAALKRNLQVRFADLRVSLEIAPLDPGNLAIPLHPPDWERFAPAPLSGLCRVFQAGQHERAVQQARAQFEVAVLDTTHRRSDQTPAH